MLKGTRIFRSHVKIVFRNDCAVRSKHYNEGYNFQRFGQTSKKFHKQQTQDYPATKQLPLPLNIEDLASSEKLKFSPQRSRDITSSYISSSTSSFTDAKSDVRLPVDDRIECYDCFGAINLSSAMQTNVPFPFVSRGKPIHLNMPGGQWRQKEKYVSEDLNNVHHINTRELHPRSGTSCSLGSRTGTRKLYFCSPSCDLNSFPSPWSFTSIFNSYQLRAFYTMKQKVETCGKEMNKHNKQEDPPFTFKRKLKATVKAYVPVIIAVYVGISIVSTGCFYLLIHSGIDLPSIKSFGGDEGAATAGIGAGIVLVYAIQKNMWIAHAALSIGAAPFVVKKLRKMGILKTLKS